MVIDHREHKRTIRSMWFRVAGISFVAVLAVLAFLLIAQKFDSKYEPPPTTSRSVIDASIGPGCRYTAANVGGVVEIHEAAGLEEMVIGDIPHGEVLDVQSVRVDFIEIRRPMHGFVDRRLTQVDCN